VLYNRTISSGHRDSLWGPRIARGRAHNAALQLVLEEAELEGGVELGAALELLAHRVQVDELLELLVLRAHLDAEGLEHGDGGPAEDEDGDEHDPRRRVDDVALVLRREAEGQREGDRAAQARVHHDELVFEPDALLLLDDCPGRKTPFLVVKRPSRPYKNAMENRFNVENVKAT
jgi:hypothetical protein